MYVLNIFLSKEAYIYASFCAKYINTCTKIEHYKQKVFKNTVIFTVFGQFLKNFKIYPVFLLYLKVFKSLHLIVFNT